MDDYFVYHASPIQNLKVMKSHTAQSYPQLGDVVFASYSKDFAGCFGYNWHDGMINQRTVSSSDPDNLKIYMRFLREFDFEELDKPFSIYGLGVHFFNPVPGHDIECFKSGDVDVLKEFKYNSWIKFLQDSPKIILENVDKIKNYKDYSIRKEHTTMAKSIFLINESYSPENGDNYTEVLSETVDPVTKNRQVKIRTVLQTLDEANKNRRVYPKNLYVGALEGLQEDIRYSRTLGELDHPLLTGNSESDANRHFIVLYSLASHKFNDVQIEGSQVIGTVETLLTDKGFNMAGLIRSGVPVGFSVRAVGQTRAMGSGMTEITAPFNLITWDCVSNPSHAQARMTEVVLEGTKSFQENTSNQYLAESIAYNRMDILQELCNIDTPKTKMSELESLVKKLDSKIKQGKGNSREAKKVVEALSYTYIEEPDDKQLDTALVDFLQAHVEGRDPIEDAFMKYFR